MTRPDKTKKKTRNAAATKAALLRAGERLFAEHGFDRTTLDAISETAGANKAMIAYYFGGKEKLYEAILEDVVASVLGRVSARAAQYSSPEDELREYIRILGEAILERPTFSAIIVREYLGGTMQERERPASLISQFFKTTNRIYRAGRRTGAFVKTDPHMLHLSIVGSLIYFTITKPYREAMKGKPYWPLTVPEKNKFIAHTQRMILTALTAGQ